MVAHLARNADGPRPRLVRAAVDGTGETMYASPEARDADIEAGAGRRRAASCVDDVDRTAPAPLADAMLADGSGRSRPSVRLERTPGQFPVKAKTSRSCGCARWRSTTSTCARGYDSGRLEPEAAATLLLDEAGRAGCAPATVPPT